MKFTESILFAVGINFRWKFNQANEKQYFPMNYDHPIHEMLDHAVVSADNTLACVTFMASPTGTTSFFSLLK